MDLSIFDSGLSRKAYQTATKKRLAKKKTNKEWLVFNKAKLEEMTKEQILNNVVRHNQSSVNGHNFMFRLIGFMNKSLTLPINGKGIDVIPCESYEDSIRAYETALTLYEEDADFQQSINKQLKKHCSSTETPFEIVPLEEVETNT